MNSDLKFSLDGDLVLENGDFQMVHKREFVEQSARHRIKTSDPDWVDYQVKEIGANLEDLIGKPNSAETAREGMRRISRTLLKDGLVDKEDLYIKPVPVSKAVIVFLVFIQVSHNTEPIGFDITFNLETGLTVRSA